MIKDFGNLDVTRGDPLIGTFQSALSGYKAPIEQATQNIGLAPTAPKQAQYLATQTPGGVTPEMTSGTTAAQQGLQNFYQSPEYQALYGGNPTDMTTQSVQERFQNDPGYNFALQEGLKATQSNAIARGQQYSPAMQEALMKYGTGLASQNFDTYRTGLSNTFNQYQSQLQAMSQMGAQSSGAGAQLAANTGQQLNANATGYGTGSANLSSQTGQQLSNNAMNAATNTANMAIQQGSNIAGNYTGQGDTQANAAIAAGQARASQSQYQNSQAASGLGGLGSLVGAGATAYGALSGGGLGSLFSTAPSFSLFGK